jgi:hypothetical protein
LINFDFFIFLLFETYINIIEDKMRI